MDKLLINKGSNIEVSGSAALKKFDYIINIEGLDRRIKRSLDTFSIYTGSPKTIEFMASMLLKSKLFLIIEVMLFGIQRPMLESLHCSGI